MRLHTPEGKSKGPAQWLGRILVLKQKLLDHISRLPFGGGGACGLSDCAGGIWALGGGGRALVGGGLRPLLLSSS